MGSARRPCATGPQWARGLWPGTERMRRQLLSCDDLRGLENPASTYAEGLRFITSSIPIKPPYFARCKSTNYLPNVLVVMEAKDKGADNGIFIDAHGMIGESSNMNVAFVTRDRVLRHPTFDAILAVVP